MHLNSYLSIPPLSPPPSPLPPPLSPSNRPIFQVYRSQVFTRVLIKKRSCAVLKSMWPWYVPPGSPPFCIHSSYVNCFHRFWTCGYGSVARMHLVVFWALQASSKMTLIYFASHCTLGIVTTTNLCDFYQCTTRCRMSPE